MPAVFTDARWLSRFQGAESDVAPLFSGWNGHDPEGLPNQLRQVFAFLRRHGNGRYTAQSLMKLLAAADRLDDVLATGVPVNASDFPTVVTATIPFEYDEETEVKRGGMVAAGVVLPDGRLMMAVNENMRRAKVGTALYRFTTSYIFPNPVVWVHQANREGGQFALAIGLMPREVNSRGAVAYSEGVLREDDNIASPATDDWEIEDALSMVASRPRPNRPRRRIAVEDIIPSLRAQPVYPEDDECYDDEPEGVRY